MKAASSAGVAASRPPERDLGRELAAGADRLEIERGRSAVGQGLDPQHGPGVGEGTAQLVPKLSEGVGAAQVVDDWTPTLEDDTR